MRLRSWLFAWCCAFVWACGAPTGCACGGFTPLPQGSYTGPKLNSAGAARLTTQGFDALNQNAPSILQFFAPGGTMQVPVPCSYEQVAIGGFNLVQLAVADTGSFACTSESCGRMNGTCDATDVGQAITLTFTGLTFAPRAPDLLEARVTATVQTGALPISSRGGNSSALCLFNGRAKFTVDLDTGRAAPPSNDLALDIRFTIDSKWDQLLSLEVAQVGNAQACSGSATPPNCIDPNDIEILNEGCSALNITQLSAVKTLLINQLANSLKTQLTDALAEANCAACGPAGECPTYGTATSSCEPDAGACLDTTTGKCVPGLMGTEGRLEVGQALGPLGAPAGAALLLSLGAGGGATASDAGLTVGLRGGAKELAVADCVAPVTRPTPPMLALPDLDADAPGAYDVGLSVSNQFLDEVLLRAQQSGALCLELGTETVAALESGLLATLLPSLDLLTEKKNVPLRVVIRPVNPPSATVGEGTVDADGKPLDPLVRLTWRGLELDVYALIEDRLARLFTVSADLSLPLGITLDGCSGFTPVVGSLQGAVTNVAVKNNELLAEPVSALQNLVPSLLTLAEPQLASGLAGFQVPEFNGFTFKFVAARGVGRVTGTQTFHHVGLYADLLDPGDVCTPTPLRASGTVVRSAVRQGDEEAALALPAGEPVSWRVDEGLWSTWQRAGSSGVLTVQHPRLRLGGTHALDVRTTRGEVQRLTISAPLTR